MSRIRRIFHLFFAKDRAFVSRLRGLIGFTPANIGLFKQAFYHRSSNNNNTKAQQNNERLEFLGDAILSSIVAEYLYRKYPGSDEGFLTKMRSKIVKRQTLNEIAEKMSLDILLREYNQTRISQSMLGNALEALVGAIYLELGYTRTQQYVVSRILRQYLDIHELESFDDNFKSQLLEWCQKNGKTIHYEVISKYKSDHRDRFKIGVQIDGQMMANADDFNKKSAEQTASEKAMKMLGILDETPL